MQVVDADMRNKIEDLVVEFNVRKVRDLVFKIAYMDENVDKWLDLVIEGLQSMLYQCGSGIKREILFHNTSIIKKSVGARGIKKLDGYDTLITIHSAWLEEAIEIRRTPLP